MPSQQPSVPTTIPDEATAPASINNLTAAATGGVARVQGEFVLGENDTMTLESSLTIITTGLLRIEGHILVPSGRSINILLASEGASVFITDTAIVGHDADPPPSAKSGASDESAGPIPVAGKDGLHGGWVSILAPAGLAEAQARDGGHGGNISIVGTAVGDLVLTEIGQDIVAGRAGPGGHAMSRGGHAWSGAGAAGDAGQSGFAGVKVLWLPPSKIDAGWPADGGVAWANGGVVQPDTPGTNAEAKGGDASNVSFAPVVPQVIPPNLDQVVPTRGTIGDRAFERVVARGGEARPVSGPGSDFVGPVGGPQPSGKARAEGGLGSERSAVTPVTAGPNPPAGSSGGVAAVAACDGS